MQISFRTSSRFAKKLSDSSQIWKTSCERLNTGIFQILSSLWFQFHQPKQWFDKSCANTDDFLCDFNLRRLFKKNRHHETGPLISLSTNVTSVQCLNTTPPKCTSVNIGILMGRLTVVVHTVWLGFAIAVASLVHYVYSLSFCVAIHTICGSMKLRDLISANNLINDHWTDLQRFVTKWFIRSKLYAIARVWWGTAR